MGTLAQTVLPFKLEATEEMLTANAGLALFGEFMRGLGLQRWLTQEMPHPGSGRGYQAESYVTPLALMLTGGGRSLEDLRTLKNDLALNTLLKQTTLPSTDAFGDWLRRTGAGQGLAGLDRINQRTVATRLRQSGITRHTLDCDASQIVAEKEAAHITYKGEQGYMPMIGHLAEAGVIIHDEFREGNIAPATQNLEFIKSCEACLPKGHVITNVRLDSAGYQSSIFNYLEDTGKTFAIGGRLDRPTQQVIADIPEASWKDYPDCALAETLHCMNETKQAFRLIVIRYKRQVELFDDAPKYHVIASNRVESTEATLVWYRQRGEVSEIRHQGIEDRLWHGTYALRAICSQCRFLSYWGYRTQFVCPVQALGVGRGLATPQGSDRALAFISFAGQAGTSCGCVGIEGGEISARVVSSYP